MKRKKIIIGLSVTLAITTTLAIGLGIGVGIVKNQKPNSFDQNQKTFSPHLNSSKQNADPNLIDSLNKQETGNKKNDLVLDKPTVRESIDQSKTEQKDPLVDVSFVSAPKLLEDIQDETKFKLELNISNVNNQYVVVQLSPLIANTSSTNIVSAKTKVVDNKVQLTFNNLDLSKEYLLTSIKLYKDQNSDSFKELKLESSIKLTKLKIKSYEKIEALKLSIANVKTNIQYSIISSDPNNVLDFKKDDTNQTNTNSDKYEIKVQLDSTKYPLKKDNEFVLELIDTTIKKPKPIILEAKLAENLKDLVFNGTFYRNLQKQRKYKVVNLNLKNKPNNVSFQPKKEYSFLIKKQIPTYRLNQDLDIERPENKRVDLSLTFTDPEALVDYQGTLTLKIAPIINGKVDETKTIEKQAQVIEYPRRHIEVSFNQLEHKEYMITWFGTRSINFNNNNNNNETKFSVDK